jgi:hypothetical protein
VAGQVVDLSGETPLVQGELYFIPDGYCFWVPADEKTVTVNVSLKPRRRYRIWGHMPFSTTNPTALL